MLASGHQAFAEMVDTSVSRRTGAEAAQRSAGGRQQGLKRLKACCDGGPQRPRCMADGIPVSAGNVRLVRSFGGRAVWPGPGGRMPRRGASARRKPACGHGRKNAGSVKACGSPRWVYRVLNPRRRGGRSADRSRRGRGQVNPKTDPCRRATCGEATWWQPAAVAIMRSTRQNHLQSGSRQWRKLRGGKCMQAKMGC